MIDLAITLGLVAGVVVVAVVAGVVIVAAVRSAFYVQGHDEPKDL